MSEYKKRIILVCIGVCAFLVSSRGINGYREESNTHPDVALFLAFLGVCIISVIWCVALLCFGEPGERRRQIEVAPAAANTNDSNNIIGISHHHSAATATMYRSYYNYIEPPLAPEDIDRSSSGSLCCIICLDRQPNAKLHPCEHMGMCIDCVEQLSERCPLCRRRIHAVLFWRPVR